MRRREAGAGGGAGARGRAVRILTFNVQNLRLRRPGGRPRLDGARDTDSPEDAGPGAAALDLADRRLTARVIAEADADVVCLQEVFDAATLDFFHDHLLRATGAAPWPFRVCLPGNDGRGRDVAVMSRRPLEEVASHARLTAEELGLPPLPGAAGRPVFRRDCLEVLVSGLRLYVCHFKAPGPEPAAAWTVRRREAEALRALIARRFADPGRGLWLIAGDLNEPPPGAGEPAIAPILPPFSVDLVARMPEAERWTWAGQGRRARPDALLASPALGAACPGAVPRALRAGMGAEAGPDAGPRLPDVGRHRPHASDHAALLVDLPGF